MAVVVQALEMRESPDHLGGPKAITDVTLLVAEAGRRGTGDGGEGHGQESKALSGGTADGEAVRQAVCGPAMSAKGSQVP